MKQTPYQQLRPYIPYAIWLAIIVSIIYAIIHWK